jgi:tetratricopeptide (TPR) repeat protein
MTAEVIAMPRFYGPTAPSERRPKGRAEIISMLSKPDAYELYKRAYTLDESEDTVELALALYREALRLDPQLAIAATNIGGIIHRCGDISTALAWFDRALELDPHQPAAHHNRGHILLGRGEAAAAEAAFRAAVRLDPAFADAWYNLGVASYALSKWSEAREAFSKYVELDSTGTAEWRTTAEGLVAECDGKGVWNLNDRSVKADDRERLLRFIAKQH